MKMSWSITDNIFACCHWSLSNTIRYRILKESAWALGLSNLKRNEWVIIELNAITEIMKFGAIWTYMSSNNKIDKNCT